LEQRGRLHRFVLHRHSSQAFALNLFAPLNHDGVVAVMHHLGMPVAEAAEPEFEYEDASDALAEARTSSPHKTQIDVVLRGRSGNGQQLLALIEVKLTETDFSTCSAYHNDANPRRDNCYSPGLFGSSPTNCFQLNNHGVGRRLYDAYLAGSAVRLAEAPRNDGGCLVRTGLNQPMRNLALAHRLLADKQADHVVYALAAPSGHQSIWRRFRELQDAFPDSTSRTIVALPAENVAAEHPDGGRTMRDRYPRPILERDVTP
jgi:hypothetical protein